VSALAEGAGALAEGAPVVDDDADADGVGDVVVVAA
jgi:hypothetical protein